jgi:hypothetical protein
MLDKTLSKIVGTVGQVVGQIGEAGGSIVGIRHGTEEPSYTVEQRIGDVEIRQYGDRVAAETTIEADEEAARNEGFRRLAGYIFGGNKSKTKIAMTAPVAQKQNEKIAMTAPVAAQRSDAGQWVIRFFMPSKQTMDTLPTPNDDRVRLVTVPAERVAVLRFAGLPRPEAIAERSEELRKTLHANAVATKGDTFTWFYDPPWTIPFRRRNEVVAPL